VDPLLISRSTIPVDRFFAEWLKGHKQKIVEIDGGFEWFPPGAKKTRALQADYYRQHPERF
jgi:hypothetical protein